MKRIINEVLLVHGLMMVDQSLLHQDQIYLNQILIPYYLKENKIYKIIILFFSKYLFSLIYELDVCNIGDALLFATCRDTDCIKLYR